MLILASQSPRRRELLAQAGYVFEVQASAVPEVLGKGESGSTFALRLAREKAEAVFSSRRSASKDPEPVFVLGADTVVLVDREILGKPTDLADAARMLRRLSGKTHRVVTGVAIVAEFGGRIITDSAAEVTRVTMRALSPQEISGYLATGEPMDKAGAYAIQGYAGRWIPRIQGCYFNVVGLPLARVAALLEAAQERLGSSSHRIPDLP